MAQADGVVANGTGSAVRSDINGQYAALWSNHSGSTEPSSGRVAYQFWADTNTSILKIRNSANNAWINLFTLAGGIDVDAASNFNEDVTFTGASYNLVWDKSDNALEFADNAKCTFGASDLSIYHDATNSYINNNTGILNISGDDVRLRSLGGETYVQGVANGATYIYFDSSQKFETTAGGAKITGNGVVTNDLLVDSDSGKLKFGLGEDLQIFHNSTDNYIDATAGNLYLRGPADASKWIILQAHSGENSIIAKPDGNVELYFNGAAKLETTSTGVYVHGGAKIAGDCFPDNNGTNRDCGQASLRWRKIYAANGSIDTSDKNEKNNIVNSDLGLNFINQLNPVSYKWNDINRDNNIDKTHYGLIAQEVEEVIISSGKTINDFGGLDKPDNASMGLKYSAFISPLIKAVQELSAKVAALEAK